MSNWKLHTPNGVNDILPDECAVKKEIESTIWSVFSSIGYKEVETPTFEYYDCYLGLSGQISQEHMFKFFDEQGRILALRPDFTTSIARMAATKVANSDKPQRYLYTGNVYRVEQTQGARQREFTQSGIELIGSYSPSADAEVISAAMEAVLAVGIEEFSMEIGQIAFFNGLVKQAGLDEQSIEKLRERIDSKDSVGIKTITDKLDIDDNIKNMSFCVCTVLKSTFLLTLVCLKVSTTTQAQSLSATHTVSASLFVPADVTIILWDNSATIKVQSVRQSV